MLINEIDHVGFDFKDGLSDIHLRGLKKIVVVAGPNGAGKSRLIRRVYRMSGSRVDSDNNEYAFKLYCECMRLSGPIYEMDDPKFTINKPETYYPNDPRKDLWDKVSNLEMYRDTRAIGVKLIRHENDNAYHRRNDLHNILIIHQYLTRDTTLKDSSDLTYNDIHSKYRDCDSIGMRNMPETATSYIQQVLNYYREATHQDYMFSEKQQYISQFKSLNDLVKAYLGVSIERDKHGRATLFGKEIAKARLSDGQTMLLFFAISLHAQGSKLSNAILMIDEPENHLHPESMLAVFDRITECNENGQIWVATHSVPLLAHLYDKYRDFVSLIYMNEGKASFSGRSPETVLNSLMGGTDNILSLRKFIDLPEVLAINNFTADCLSDSLPKEYVPGDPQCELALNTIEKQPDTHKIKILDYGAGYCRLLDALAVKHGEQLNNNIDYVAYERESSMPICTQPLGKYYKDVDTRLFSDRSKLFRLHTQHSFDYVVLCNVLHEISPSEWLSMFQQDSLIETALKPNGFLLIIEDYMMPKGEYSHSYGFIVLDSEALRELFCITDDDGYQVISNPGKFSERLRAHKLPASCLSRINSHSRSKALRATMKIAEEKIGEIRAKTYRDYQTGLALALWLQQYANVSLALRDLS